MDIEHLQTFRERHPSLRGDTFLHDRFIVIVAADDPWHERGHVPVRDLAVRRLLMREHGAGTRAFVDAALRAAGVHPVEMLEVASLEALKRMAEAGVGVAVVPRIAVEREAAEGRLRALEIDAPGNRLAYRLLWHKDKTPAPGVALFRDVMGLRRQASA